MQNLFRSRCSTKSQDGAAKRGSALFVVMKLNGELGNRLTVKS